MAEIANLQGFVGSLLNSTTELARRLPPPPVTFTTVKVNRLVRESGKRTYRLAPWGEVVRPVIGKTLRPGKIDASFRDQPAEAVLESAFSGPGAPLGAFDRATDEALWAAALRFVNEQSAQPNEALTLSRAVLQLCLVRAGCEPLSAQELP
jgi:hypothetical protein